MFVQMRRAERALPEEESLELLCCGQYGILSTIGSDGYPYGVPMSYVYKNHKILLHSAGEGHKISNLTFSDKVSFCVVGKSQCIEINCQRLQFPVFRCPKFGNISVNFLSAWKSEIIISNNV